MNHPRPATLEEILEAQQHAQEAAQENQPVTACPYKTTTPDDDHRRFLQIVWARAYRETQAILRAESNP